MALITHMPIIGESANDWKTNLYQDSYVSIGNIDNLVMSGYYGPLLGYLKFRGTTSILHNINIPKTDTLGISFWIGMPNNDSQRTTGNHEMIKLQTASDYYIYASFVVDDTYLTLKVGTSKNDFVYCEQLLLTDLESIYKMPSEGLRWIPFQFSLNFRKKVIITSDQRELSLPNIEDITNQKILFYIGSNIPDRVSDIYYTEDNTYSFTNLWSIGDIRIYDKMLSKADVSNIRQRLTCHYTFDDIGEHKNAPYLTDKSGCRSDASTVNMVYTYSGDKAYLGKKTADFNASRKSYIVCPKWLHLQYALSWSLWLYMDDWSLYKTNDMKAISCSNGGYGGFNLSSYNDYVSFKISDGLFGDTWDCYGSVKWSDLSSGWHMFSCTFDGLYVKAYIDGELIRTWGKTSTFFGFGYFGATSGTVLSLGAEAANAYRGTEVCNYFTGKMDDFRFYSSTLSDEEIKTLYNKRASIDNTYKMRSVLIEEGTGLSINKQGITKLPTIIENEYFYTIDGAKFLKIFSHDVETNKSLFESGEIQNVYTEQNRFSRLNDISFFRGTDGKFEFLLKYPQPKINLPIEYQQLESFWFNGTSTYVDLGVKATNNTRVITKIQPGNSTTTANMAVYCSRSGLNSNSFAFMFVEGNGRHDYYNMQRAISLSNVNGGKYIIDQNKHSLEVIYNNGQYVSIGSESTFTASENMYIGASNANGIGNYFKGNVYYFKMYDNDKLIRYLIPCKRRIDGMCGFYDLIEHNFYAINTTDGGAEYYDDLIYNRWKQSLDPLTETIDSSSHSASYYGYEPIQISYSQNWTYGFGLSRDVSSYLSSDTYNYAYELGLAELRLGAIRGPESLPVNKVELYIRIDNTNYTGNASINKDIVFMDEFIEE